MKKRHLLFISTIVLFLVKQGFGQHTTPSTYFDFKKGEKVYVFGDKVNVRNQPNTDGKILTTLSVGTTVEVLNVITKERQQPFTVKGLEGPWVRIKYDDSGTIGFVWAPLLTNVVLPSPHYTYLFGLVKAKKGKLFGQLRAVKYQDIWEKVEFEVIGDLEHSVQARLYGNRGYRAIDNVIEIYFEHFHAHLALGHVTFYTIQDGVYYVSHQFQYIGNMENEWNSLIYPDDKEGRTNRILKRKIVGISDDIGNKETTVTLTVWDWEEEQKKLVRVK